MFVAETAEEALEKAKKATGNAALTMADLEQDPDVLDTWFSSWLWPFSTMGWPEKTADLDYYYPTTDLVTAQDIIFFWVARMMMAGIHFMGKPPFSNIVIHGIVRDAQGRKMSKSLGNSLDPLEIIDAYSADALRFSLALITSLECDTKVDKSKFEIGRNFATKIWNAARFLQMNAEELGLDVRAPLAGISGLSSDEKHILLAADKACRKIDDTLSRYRIQDGALAVYDFFWTQICDGYVEYAKDAADKKRAFAILADVFWKALRLLHPYMPFVTEEVAHQLGYLADGETIMRAEYPKGYSDGEKAAWGLDEATYAFVDAKRAMITDLRALRGEYKISPAAFVKVTVQSRDEETAGLLRADVDTLKKAMRAESVDITTDKAELAMPGKLGALGTVYLSLEGLVDKAAESKRIAGELKKLDGFIKGAEAKLANKQFTDHAPAQIVETARKQLEENRQKQAQLQKLAKLFS